MIGGFSFLIYATSKGIAGIICLIAVAIGTFWNRQIIADGLEMHSSGEYGVKTYKFKLGLFSNLPDTFGDGGFIALIIRSLTIAVVMLPCLLEELLFNLFNVIFFNVKKPIITILVIDTILLFGGLIYYFVAVNS
jgi:hypothetical protein